MRSINEIIIHCSATREGQDISVDTIKKWHVEGRGWSDIGYHFYIDRNGIIQKGRAINLQGAHTKKNNKDSIGVCYEGTHAPSLKQVNSLINLYRQLNSIYKITIDDWHGHNEYSSKKCPGFPIADLKVILNKM